ncbi:hypothetical protein ACIBG8_42525 [Nonomuraea sp. NPDC050556]|uniref:hypothetical protein n=1 Tax=Nonomuraea sp. NPDC050556 TaxID=3364369 RepID=UPI0037B4337A
MNLADLTDRTGLAVLDHLERTVTIPVIDGLQAQGDLIVIPLETIAHAIRIWREDWRPVPPEGVELLRGAAGGNPHTLVADPGTCLWTVSVRDTMDLALGALTTTAPAYLLHPEHGATGLTPGTYVVRRQREHNNQTRTRRLVAD